MSELTVDDCIRVLAPILRQLPNIKSEGPYRLPLSTVISAVNMDRQVMCSDPTAIVQSVDAIMRAHNIPISAEIDIDSNGQEVCHGFLIDL